MVINIDGSHWISKNQKPSDLSSADRLVLAIFYPIYSQSHSSFQWLIYPKFSLFNWWDL